MYRFFSPSKNISVEKIIIPDKKQVHHIKDVLRLKINDGVVVFDDKGREYVSTIEELSAQKVILKINRTKKVSVSDNPKIAVACAIPKKAKMGEIIDKLTQLGVDRIIPLITERVIVKLDSDKKMSRRLRWEKIALTSAKQCQRNSIPIIEPIKNMEEVLRKSQDYDLKLIAALSDERKRPREVLAKRQAKNILIFIGPEGDFTQQEIDLAKKAGCILLTLGRLVLRVDTAAIAITSFITLYQL